MDPLSAGVSIEPPVLHRFFMRHWTGLKRLRRGLLSEGLRSFYRVPVALSLTS